MECNLNDFTFDTYFAALLTPIELTDNENNFERLPPINTLGATHAGTSLFSSLNNSRMLAENSYFKQIKNEDYSTELSTSTGTLDENFLEEGRSFKDDILYASEKDIVDSIDSPNSSCALTEEEIMNSPIPIKQENVEIVKISDSPSGEKKLKRSRAEDDSSSSKDSKKKRRVNYCFDIHKVYCPFTKKEKYYCNVSLQGKLQETVDLIKGKRGKYAYTFYDQRKQRKERRYWPSQSCGPVLEDTCNCERCNVDAPKKVPISSAPVDRNETNAKDDNCVIFLEEVFLDM